jgi:hypothetical protein
MADSKSMNETMQAFNFGYLSTNKEISEERSSDNFYIMDIPFDNMIQQEQNKRKDRFFQHEIIPMTPRVLSFYCESLVEATYDFKVKSVSAIYDENLLRIN